jgi:DNA adenine methylase
MLIPYLGEKSKFASFIVPNVPNDISTYVEPFGGMFGIFFALDFVKFKDVKFIYNDVNYLNYNLFNQLRDNHQFIDLVKKITVDINRYKLALKEILTEKNDVRLAINWLIILTCSSPYEIGKESWRGSSEFDIFKIKYNAYKFHINKITEIDKLDYKEIISKYDSESTFFYVDPPYMGKESYYINHDFNSNTHIELANILNNIKGRFVLSYYNFNGLQELYKNCKIESKVTPMGTELIILNF